MVEADRVDEATVRVLLLRLELERGCQVRGEGVRGEARAVGFPFNGSPASQTLIVPSEEPETIVFPSGEKSTEVIKPLWAFVFSLLSSSVAARGRLSQFKKGISGFQLNARLHPRL